MTVLYTSNSSRLLYWSSASGCVGRVGNAYEGERACPSGYAYSSSRSMWRVQAARRVLKHSGKSQIQYCYCYMVQAEGMNTP